MAHLTDIIKYEGDNSTFIWKHPCEDFNNMTQLIVHESQEAIFFMNGQALNTFGAGRYTLETQNLPKLDKYVEKATGGKTPFHCEVYFINKTVQMSIKWGTDSKVRFIEPTLGLPLEIGACGEMNLAVSDSRKLLIKLVGTMNGIAWEERGNNFTKSIQAAFRPLISTAVKSNLPAAIKSEQIDILEIDENLEKLSNILRKSISPGFEEYGLTIPQFYVSTVLLPENDPNFKRMRELHTVAFQTRIAESEAFVKIARTEADTRVRTTQVESEGQVRVAQAESDAAVAAARRKAELEKQATETEIAKHEAERELIRAQASVQASRLGGLAEAEVMHAKGYDQKDVMHTEVQKAYAESIGTIGSGGGAAGGGSGVLGEFVNLGVGLAAAGNVGQQMSEMLKGFNSSVNEAPSAKCAKCGANLPANAKFCLECGEKVTPAISENTIVCPECGKTVAKGKFCPECGHKFITNCPKCGAIVPSGAKFCLDCGEKL